MCLKRNNSRLYVKCIRTSGGRLVNLLKHQFSFVDARIGYSLDIDFDHNLK